MSFWGKTELSSVASFATTAPVVVDHDVARLKTEAVGDFWRVAGLAPGATRIHLDVTLPAPAPIEYIYGQRPRFSRRAEKAGPPTAPTFASTDTVRAIFYAGAIGEGQQADTGDEASGMRLGVGAFGLYRPGAAPSGAFRLEFDALSRAVSPENWFDLGLLRFGAIERLTVDYAALVEGVGSNASQQRADKGARLYRRSAQMWRTTRLTFRAILQAEREAVRTLIYDTYDGYPFFLALDEARPFDSWMMATWSPPPDLGRVSRNFSRIDVDVAEAL